MTYNKKYMFGLHAYDSHMVSKYFEISCDETNKGILLSVELSVPLSSHPHLLGEERG